MTIRQLGLRREDMRFLYARSTSPCCHASNSSPARESDQIGFLRSAGGVDRRSRDPETVVGVFELRWNARSRRCSGNFNVVAPGATSRRSPSGVGRPLRVSFRRIRVVVGVVPVDTPFMNINPPRRDAEAFHRHVRFRSPSRTNAPGRAPSQVRRVRSGSLEVLPCVAFQSELSCATDGASRPKSTITSGAGRGSARCALLSTHTLTGLFLLKYSSSPLPELLKARHHELLQPKFSSNTRKECYARKNRSPQ